VSDHAGFAVLVTVASDGTIFDRRRIELIDPGPQQRAGEQQCRHGLIHSGIEIIKLNGHILPAHIGERR
jgi:hypothetical protein